MRYSSKIVGAIGVAVLLMGQASNGVRADQPRGIVHTFSTPNQEGLTRIAVAGSNEVYLGSERGEIWKWNLAQDAVKPIPNSPVGNEPVSQLHRTSGGELIVQTGRRLLMGAPEQPLREIPLPELPQIAVSPAGDRFAAVGQEPPIQFFSLPLGQKTHRVDRQVWVDEMRFSPDGQFLATSRFGRLYLWKAETGELVWKNRLEGNVQGFVFTPDQSKIFAAVERGGIWVMDVEAGRILDRLQRTTGANDEDERHRLAFSADGMLLAETEHRNQIQLWETMTGQPILWLEKQAGSIRDLQFLPDGVRLVSVDSNGRAILWDLSDPAFAGPFEVGKPYGKDELGQLWQMLGHARGEAAWTAMIALKHQPGQLLELIDHPPNDDLLIQRLIARLEDDHFRIRQAAFRSLRQLRLTAEPLLRETLKTTESAEVTARVRRLLEYLSGPQKETQREILRASEAYRQLRLIQLLRWMGNAAACKRLEFLGKTATMPHVRTRAENALKSMEPTSHPPRQTPE